MPHLFYYYCALFCHGDSLSANGAAVEPLGPCDEWFWPPGTCAGRVLCYPNMGIPGSALLVLSRGDSLQVMTENMSRRVFIAAATAACVPPLFAQARTRTPAQLIAAARRQIGVTRSYDPAYTKLAFPGGDVDRAKGVCTDVVIRAYRDAFGLDLQALVNADMKAAFSAYPKRWGLRRPDSNIDHRRVPNLQTYFARAGAKLPLTTIAADWQPGDIFTSLIDNRLPHIGIVSDRTSRARPLIIHNIGRGTQEEDMLFAYPLTGHYRWGFSP